AFAAEDLTTGTEEAAVDASLLIEAVHKDGERLKLRPEIAMPDDRF
ncbi:MAG: hypothetical protein JWL84_4894, partial [Rhodospirillales bacterium]|nr:hypothetical protein [Rhodospirillales bacterium]